MRTIGVVGYGYVGKAVANGFTNIAEIRIYDIQPELATHSFEDVCKSDFIFIAVPTPIGKDGECDISIVKEVISRCSLDVKDGIVIIKSTVPPGTTKLIQNNFSKMKLVFNPEFLTESNYLEDFLHPERVIIGGDDGKVTEKVFELYRELFPKPIPIHKTESTTAELVKYVSNCFLASKVTYFNEIYDICQKLNINYYEMLPMVTEDKRVGESHTTVPGYHGRGFSGSCFPKDMMALIHFCKIKGIDCSFLESVWKKNKEIRDKEGD